MKKSEVPQDCNATLDGGRKAVYAVDENGNYTLTPSNGWEVEEIVTTMAVDALKQQAELARQRVINGLSSPLEFHMYDKRMDVTVLAQTVGIAKWRVRRHLRPEVYSRLKPSMLERYADALGLSIEQLGKVEPGEL